MPDPTLQEILLRKATSIGPQPQNALGQDLPLPEGQDYPSKVVEFLKGLGGFGEGRQGANALGQILSAAVPFAGLLKGRPAQKLLGEGVKVPEMWSDSLPANAINLNDILAAREYAKHPDIIKLRDAEQAVLKHPYSKYDRVYPLPEDMIAGSKPRPEPYWGPKEYENIFEELAHKQYGMPVGKLTNEQANQIGTEGLRLQDEWYKLRDVFDGLDSAKRPTYPKTVAQKAHDQRHITPYQNESPLMQDLRRQHGDFRIPTLDIAPVAPMKGIKAKIEK